VKLKRLTEKQKRFIDFYVELGNATEAARKAGYSEKTAKQIGNENLTKLDFFIKERLKELEDARIAKAEEVLQYLTAVMRGEETEEVVVVEGQGDGFSTATTIGKQVSARERIKAAELLAKRYGLLSENMNINAEMAVKIVDDINDDS
jgi:phage terminase small subunit